MKSNTLVHLAFLATAVASLLTGRQECGEGLETCAPSGATSLTTPNINSDAFKSLYTDLLSSSLPASKPKRSSPAHVFSWKRTPSLCCQESLSCLTLSGLSIPFCYDRFTTNFYLPDNSYGTVATGAYSSPNGDSANLISGDFTLADGSKGNIYGSAGGLNTKTLPIPSQFTGTGIGSAIPATALGEVATRTITSTIPGTTIPASTIEGTTRTVTISESSGIPARIETTTVLANTIPASTIGPKAVTITTTERAASTSSNAAVAAAGVMAAGGAMIPLGLAAALLV